MARVRHVRACTQAVHMTCPLSQETRSSESGKERKPAEEKIANIQFARPMRKCDIAGHRQKDPHKGKQERRKSNRSREKVATRRQTEFVVEKIVDHRFN